MQATEIPGSKFTAARKFSNTSHCLFADLEGLGKQRTLLNYPKGHLH